MKLNTAANYNKVLLIDAGGMCGQVVDTSNSRSGGPEFEPRPLRCFVREVTLLHFVSLPPRRLDGYQWHTAGE